MATKKSYEVRFGINDTEISKQLAGIDKSLKSTQGELKLLKTNLSDNWDTSKWARAQEIGTKAVQDSIQKVELLKKRFAEMEAEGVTEKNQAAFESLRKEILAAENATERAKKELQKLNDIKLDTIRKQIKQVSDSLTSIGTKLSIGVTVPIVAAGAASVKMASDMDEAINKVDVAFGDASRTVHNFSNTTLTTYGIAKSTALDMAGYFGDMATSMGFSRQEAAEMSTQLVALAGDLASFKNISLDEAQTALSAIFTGETESMKRLGLVITETNLQSYALANGIEKTVSKMNQQEKTALRLQYTLDGTKNAQGDFARTSGNTANQLRTLSESLKELAAIAGQELIPMVLPIIKQLNQIIQKVGLLDDGTKDMIMKLAIFAAAFGPLLTVSGKMAGVVSTLVGAYKALKTAQAGAAAGQTALNVAMSANPAGAVAAAIGVLVAALGSLAIASSLTGNAAESLSKKIDGISDSYKSAAQAADKEALSQESELKLVEKLLPKYEELNNKTDKTTQEKAELKRAVDDINRVLPDNITLLDQEKGIYEGMPDVIQNTIDKRREEIKVLQERSVALAAMEAQSKLLAESGYSTIDDAKAALSEAEAAKDIFIGGSWISQALWDSFGIDTTELKLNQRYKEQRSEISKLVKDYEKYQNVINSYVNKGGSLTTYEGSNVNGSAVKTSGEKALEAYKSYRAALDHQLAMDEITTEQYYATLENYDRQYLAGYSENLAEHRKVLEELHKYKKSVQSDEVKRLEELAEAEKKAREESLKNAEDFTNKVVSLAEKEANAKIAAIDAELAARDKLKAAQESALKLQQAQAQLAFTTDEDSRESLKKEIARLKENIAEQQYQSDAEAQKAAIQAQLNQLKSNADAAVSNMRATITPESVNPYITQLMPNLTVNAQGLSVAQAQMLIQQALKTALYE